MVTHEVHRSSLRRLMCPTQDHFIFLTLLILSVTLPQLFVSPQSKGLCLCLPYPIPHTYFPSSLFLPQSKGLAVKQLEEDRVDLEQLRTRVGEDGRQIKQLEGLLENKDTEITRLTQVHMLMVTLTSKLLHNIITLIIVLPMLGAHLPTNADETV